MIQYVDDLLLCSDSQTAHEEVLDILLRHLTKVGLKVSCEKAQIALPEVTYLEDTISQCKKTLTVV